MTKKLTNLLEEFKDKGDSSTEGLLKSILSSAFNGIMTFQSIRNEDSEIVDFEWIFINDIAEEIVGIKSEELLERRLLSVMPANKETGLFDRYKKVVDSGHFATFEQYYPADEGDKCFRISAVKLEDGFTVTFQDITDLKQAVLEAETKERKYQRLFEESIDAIFLVDEGFQFLEVNTPFERLFDFAKEELTCMPLEALFSEKEAYRLFCKMLLDSSQVEEFEVDLQNKSGNVKTCLINTISLPSEEGTDQTTFLGVIRDMTKRKLADQELIQAEKLAMTGKIARTIAHEVRNPLTNLTLALEQLKDEIPKEIEDAELYFSIINRNAKRIGKLISDLLNSSKPKDLQLAQQPLNQLIEDAVELVRDRLKLQSMKLELSLDSSIPHLTLDGDQMKIALLNLFINAVEAMKPEEGLLSVTTLQHDETSVHIRVQDNGKGISKKSMNDLFEPFFTEKKEGTGLGLTTVQNIINAHKGKIRAESEVNNGTSFIISLPISK